MNRLSSRRAAHVLVRASFLHTHCAACSQVTTQDIALLCGLNPIPVHPSGLPESQHETRHSASRAHLLESSQGGGLRAGGADLCIAIGPCSGIAPRSGRPSASAAVCLTDSHTSFRARFRQSFSVSKPRCLGAG